MPPLADLTGRIFGRLVVVERSGTVNKHTMWLCRCDCGSEIIADAYNLRAGHTESCGCLQRERTGNANRTHGMTDSRLYTIWQSMKNRCYRKSYHAFHHYGGRGIRICEEWLCSFESFYDWAISHGYNDTLSIDRIDVNGNYCPANCRWATMKEQNMNKRAKNGYKIQE
nr:MAG TPA: hypothetical protein [Caudoviricetes sp.]